MCVCFLKVTVAFNNLVLYLLASKVRRWKRLMVVITFLIVIKIIHESSIKVEFEAGRTHRLLMTVLVALTLWVFVGHGNG